MMTPMTPMTPLPNEPADDLDALLRAHYSATLDPQVGRATDAFRAHLDAHHSRGRTFRLFLAAGAAIAAGLLLAMWLIPTSAPTPDHPVAVTQPRQGTTLPPASDTAPVVQAASWSRVVDDGLGLVDDRPVRRLRRNVVEAVEWVDPATGARVRQSVPSQQVFYLPVRTD